MHCGSSIENVRELQPPTCQPCLVAAFLRGRAHLPASLTCRVQTESVAEKMAPSTARTRRGGHRWMRSTDSMSWDGVKT